MTEPTLFDADSVTDTQCSAPGCQAIRFAGQQRTPTCAHDLDQAAGAQPKPRPRQCLNAIDPAHTPFPDGF